MLPSAQRRQSARIGLAFFSFVLIGANDAAVGVLLPSIRAHYAIDKSTAGLLFAAGTLGYFIAAVSSGLLVERLGRRVTLLGGAAAFSLGALAISAMPPFPALLAALLCVGLGVAILDAGFNAYIAALPERSGSRLNYLHAFYGGGALLGPLVATAILVNGWPWNVTYLVWATVGVVALAGFGLLFERRDAPLVPSHAAGEPSGPNERSNVLVATLRSRIAWACALFLLVYVGTEVSLGSWSYSLLTEERRQIPLYAGWMVSGYWLGLTLGRVALGRLADRVGSRRLIAGCLAGVIVGVLVLWGARSGAMAAAGLWLTGFSLGPIFPTTIALINDVVSQRLQQSVIGFAASLGSMGAALLPWLAGSFAQRLGLWALLPFVLCLTLTMLAFWIVLLRSTASNMAAHATSQPGGARVG
jgi:fucose permease